MIYIILSAFAHFTGEYNACFFAFLPCLLLTKGISGLDVALIAENAVLIVFAVILSVYSIRKKRHRKKKAFNINAFCDCKMPALVVRKDGTVLFCNNSAEKLFLTDKKRIKYNELYAAIRQAGTNGESKTVLKTDNSVFFAFCIYDEGTICILFTEITEYIRKEEQSNEFISVLTHEMRTPLTIIKGFAQNLEDDYATIDEQQKHKYYRDIISEADRLAELVNSTLKITKLDTGILKPETEPLDVSYCLNAYADRLKTLCNGKNIDCAVKAQGQILALFEYDSLMQLLTILCDNAVKYTREGGRISICVCSADEISAVTQNMNIFVCNTEIPLDKSRIFVYADDSGIGISKEVLPHIFEKLYSGDRKRKSGTGLGLALANSMINSIGETMIAASTEGKGSIIGFTLTKFTEEDN